MSDYNDFTRLDKHPAILNLPTNLEQRLGTRFWTLTLARYLVTALVALVASLVLSIISVLPWAGDSSNSSSNNAAVGILWIMVFFAGAALIVPFGLGITAELIQRTLEQRRFKWSRACYRALVLVPISTGIVYWAWWVEPLIQPAPYWLAKELLCLCVSGVSAYLGLRLRKHTSAA